MKERKRGRGRERNTRAHRIKFTFRAGADRCQAKSNETPRCAERSALLAGPPADTGSRISARRKSHFTGSREGQVTRVVYPMPVGRVERQRKRETKIKGRARVYNTGSRGRDAPMSSRRTDVDAASTGLGRARALSLFFRGGWPLRFSQRFSSVNIPWRHRGLKPKLASVYDTLWHLRFRSQALYPV